MLNFMTRINLFSIIFFKMTSIIIFLEKNGINYVIVLLQQKEIA
jgi:hypothetical protein